MQGPPSLILIGFDTEMLVERKEGVGLALPSHMASLQPDLASGGQEGQSCFNALPSASEQPAK